MQYTGKEQAVETFCAMTLSLHHQLSFKNTILF